MGAAFRGGARIAAAAFVLLNGFAPALAATTVKPIAFVPLDDRPVTLQLPILLGRIAGQPVRVPPSGTAGRFLTPGEPDAILSWLDSADAAGVSALVASTDMIGYGGLVASRVPGDANVPLARLATLEGFRAAHPGAYVAAFGTVMRLAPTGVPAGAAAWISGDTVDRVQDYANLPDPPVAPDDIAKAGRLRALVGEKTLDSYLGTRARNLLVDRSLVRAASTGAFDRLVLGQDDAGPTGLHLRDLAALRREVAADHAGAIVSIEPGADELGMALLARVFARNAGWTPAVRVIYSRADAASYNDRLEFAPIDVTIDRLIAACGGRRVRGDSSAAGDLDLFVRVPGTSDADESAFVGAIVAGGGSAASRPLAAVADLTFLEGQPGPYQRSLTDALIDRGVAGTIDGYASWNTTANTIGTTLAEAIAVGAGERTKTYDSRAQAEFLLDRYVDDYAFHQFVRPAVNTDLRARDVDTELLDAPYALLASSENRARLWPYALDLLAKIFPQYRDAGLVITLPWDRTFETKIDVRLRPGAAPASVNPGGESAPPA